MIQVIVACDVEMSCAFFHDAVTGVRVAHDGRLFQILEGPESAVMLGVAVVAGNGAHLAKAAIEKSGFEQWHPDTLEVDQLLPAVADRLRAFAASTRPQAKPDVAAAIASLDSHAGDGHQPAIASGTRLIPKVGGQAGDKAWIAV